jgi:hypothetical protein
LAEYTSIKDVKTKTKLLTEVRTFVANEKAEAFLSDTDLKKQKKSPEVRARDLKRADFLYIVVTTPDPPGQLAVRLAVAHTLNPNEHMENVVGRFMMDGVLKLEAEAAAQKEGAVA